MKNMFPVSLLLAVYDWFKCKNNPRDLEEANNSRMNCVLLEELICQSIV